MLVKTAAGTYSLCHVSEAQAWGLKIPSLIVKFDLNC